MSRDELAIIVALKEMYVEDGLAGGVRPMESYQRRFPGHEDLVGTEYRRLQEAELTGRGPTGRPWSLGGFRVVRELGRGGMGIVYEAEEPALGRRVALKILPFSSSLDEIQIKRFKNEGRAAAMLRHPHIVPVHSVGDEGGVHYYAMQLIEGTTLAQIVSWLRERRTGAGLAEAPGSVTLPFDAAGDASRTATFHRWVAVLGRQLAEALSHAHDMGVLHRDVKPSNVLIDRDGGAWITDFGLAHRQGEASLTMTGDVLGTLRYQSPEQALGKRGSVGERSDVYSLGVTLFEVVTLRPAFTGEQREAILRSIVFDEIPAPRRIEPAIPRELETIIMKAAAKEPAQRYGTAADLADDLARFAGGRPVLARRPTPLERAARWARRHRTAFVASVVALVIAVAALVAGLVTISGERDRARVREKQNLYFAHMRLAQQDWESGSLTRLRSLLDRHRPGPGEPDGRGWEWYYLDSLFHQEQASLAGHTDDVRAVEWSPSGDRLASAGRDGTVRIWDPVACRELSTIHHGDDVDLRSVAWHPRGDRLASGGSDGRVRVWTAGGALVHELTGLASAPPHVSSVGVTRVAFDPAGERLAAADRDGVVKVWNAAEGSEIETLRIDDKYAWAIAWSPDGTRLAAVGNTTCKVTIWSTSTWREIRSWSTQGDAALLDVAWDSAGRRLATMSIGHQDLKIWDAETGRRLAVLDAHAAGMDRVVAWSAGDRLASAGGDGRIQVWEAATGRRIVTLRAHMRGTRSVSWSPDGRRLASGGGDGLVKIWRAARPERPSVPGYALAWSPGGDRLAAASSESSDVTVYDVPTLVERRRLAFSPGVLPLCVAFGPLGRRLAAALGDGHVVVWDVDTGVRLFTARAHRDEEHEVESRTDLARAVCISPDGRWLVSGGLDGAIVIWSLPNGDYETTLETAETVGGLAFSPDGRRLASTRWDQVIQIWETGTWRELHRMRQHRAPSFASSGQHCIAWSPGGERLATGSAEGHLVVWDASTGREVYRRPGHASSVHSVSWSADGRRIATSGVDRTTKIWDASRGEELLTLRDLAGAARAVAWDATSRRLAAAAHGRVTIWDASGR